MYLKKINIKNFKAITNMEIDFTEGVNLLIGDNGVGKSSILEAVAVALFGMLKGIRGVPTKNILQDDIHFTIEEKGDASSAIRYWTPTEIAGTLEMQNESYHWRRYRLNEDGKERTKMDDDGIVKWMQHISNHPEDSLPLLCFQSDARVWQTRRGDFGKELKKKLDDRRCGYIGCLDYSLDMKGIQAWCLKMELTAFQKKKPIKEYEAFKNIVACFMQQISQLEEKPQIHYSSQLGELVYQEKSQLMPISYLSAGYQSLLWMVMNLAYRLALLNPESTDNLGESEGIVLIDEIDMHLHPKWQWNIVDALERTFPNMQFILATHSPIVISSCKNEYLILVDEDEEVRYLANAYGYSVQDVLNFRQGTTEKPEEIKKLSEQFEKALDEDELKEAKKIVGEMEIILGTDHPDVRDAREELRLNGWEE